jgi:hypothetical protein
MLKELKSLSEQDLLIIGQVLVEKMDSLNSKIQDDTATSEDKINLAFSNEILALAKNRINVQKNEKLAEKDDGIWVEKTSDSHNPHIRLHGGVLEDDPPQG